LEISTTTPAALELVEFTVGQSLDSLDPSARNGGGAGWHGASINNFPGSFAFETANFVVHGGPEVFGEGTGEGISKRRKVRVVGDLGLEG
jgi:hypothetical protein